MAIINTSKLQFDSEDGNTYIFDKNIGASVVGQDVYSTDETVVGKWIDGRPIYSKTYDLGSAKSIPKLGWYDTGQAAPSNIKDIINGTFWLGGNYSVQGVYARVASGKMSLFCIRYDNPQTVSGFKIEYTKTTDAPGSYKPTSTELTQEHLTGETLSGKPVYEKTFLYTTPSANSGVAFSVEELNIETLVSVNGSMLDGSNYYLVDGSNYNNNLSYALYINNDGKTMNLQINPNTMTRYFNRPALATLKYTKKSD